MPAYLSIELTTLSHADCDIILMDADQRILSGSSAQQDAAKAIAPKAHFEGAISQSYLHLDDEGALLLIGAGKIEDDDALAAEAAGAALYKAMRHHKCEAAQLSNITLGASMASSILQGALSQSYEFNRYFTKKDEMTLVKLGATIEDMTGLETAFDDAQSLLNGVFLARDLVTEPANILHPESFAQKCAELSSLGLEVDILGEAEMAKLGMGSLLGVGQGSRRESQMVVMKWNGGGDEAPLAFVGKGVCFDTGGISLKPAKGMEDMKWDMGGAAAVTGAMCAVASRKMKRNIVGIVGLVENMPDGNAQRPGDVVTSMSGQTIEVINTDAEGRLVLADCLTYCQMNFKPQMIIDLATLTGAIIVALGKEYAGLFANDDGLAGRITTAGEAVAEKCWQMPMGDAYQKMLKSHIADMKNIGGPWGGSITAACFLERFIDDGMPWAHIDIAGKAWADQAGHAHPSGGTGFGVRLLNRIADDWQD